MIEKAERTRYSDAELKEFEELILSKIEKAENELKLGVLYSIQDIVTIFLLQII